MMKAWDVDVDGIGYLVAARSEAEAIGVVLLLEKDSESGLTWEDHEIHEHTDLQTIIRGDGEPDESIGSLLSGLQDPEVVGCSEWL